MTSTERTVTIYGDDDEPIEVTGELIPGCRGSRDHYGQAIEPDVEDRIEILDSTRTLSERERRDAIEELALSGFIEAGEKAWNGVPDSWSAVIRGRKNPADYGLGEESIFRRNNKP